jgi:hypothetical protein
VGLAIALIVHDVLAWTQRLTLTGELTRADPKRLRHRLLHVAGHWPSTPARRLHIDARWPWRDTLVDAFARA